MKSKYYVVYYRDFANTYYLVSATADTEHLLPKDAERITRKEAIRMCRAELERQKYDRAFSGYASTEVWPIEAYLSLEHLQIEGLRQCTIDGVSYFLQNHICLLYTSPSPRDS